MRLAAIGLVLLAGATGCRKAILPPVAMDYKGVEPKVDYTELDLVLAKAVSPDGLVHAAILKDQAVRLDAQLKLLAAAGPTDRPDLFPQDTDRLVYWYNARAAWSLKLWLVNDCAGQFDRAGAMCDRQFPLDGRLMSLSRIDDVLAHDGDWRTRVVAPSIDCHGSPLLNRAFSAGGIRPLIAQRFNQYVADPSRLVVDVEKKQVLVAPALWSVRESLVKSYDENYGTAGATLQTALLPFLEGPALRRMRDLVGYACVPMREEPLKVTMARR